MRFALLSCLVVLSACRPVVDARPSCLEDDECAADEECINGACVEAVGCTPDTLNNDTAETAVADADQQDAFTGRVCPGVSEFYEVSAILGDPLIIYATWTGDLGADLDAILIDGQNEIPLLGSNSDERELGGATFNAVAPQTIELRPSSIPAVGVDYTVTFKTGAECHVDTDCVADVCVLPLHTPENPNGNPPPTELIFVPGVCATPRSPGCANPDALEGPTASESQARAIPAVSTGCLDDEDWYELINGQTGSFIFSLTHNGTIPGDYVVQVYDSIGNLLSAQGFDGIDPGITRQMDTPFITDDLYIRVTQLHDEESTYALSPEFVAETCTVDGDCAVTGIQEYGRTTCDTGACVCPQLRCAP
jgi:hypothetical protein